MNKNCGIYKITSPTGKIYIGQSRNIKARFRKYNALNCLKQVKIYRSLLKYGVENHQFDIIEYCTEDELNCSERFWQDEFDVLGENGLNCHLQECGIKARIVSQETRDKISKTSKGRTLTQEHKDRMSETRKGDKCYNFGKKASDETKKKMSDAHKGKIFSEETRKKLSESRKGKGGLSGELNNFYGKKHTQESRMKISNSLKRKAGLSGELNAVSKIVLDVQTGVYYFGIREASRLCDIKYEQLRCMLCSKCEKENITNLILV